MCEVVKDTDTDTDADADAEAEGEASVGAPGRGKASGGARRGPSTAEARRYAPRSVADQEPVDLPPGNPPAPLAGPRQVWATEVVRGRPMFMSETPSRGGVWPGSALGGLLTCVKECRVWSEAIGCAGPCAGRRDGVRRRTGR